MAPNHGLTSIRELWRANHKGLLTNARMPQGGREGTPVREAQLFCEVWTRGKQRITKSTYTSQSANHVEPTTTSPTEKRIKLGSRNSRVDPSSQKRSPRREYRARSASSIRRPPSEEP